jgi:release factor glutamine methyltransferase
MGPGLRRDDAQRTIMQTSLPLLHTTNKLLDSVSPTPWLDAVVLLEHATKLDKSKLLADIEINQETEEIFNSLVKRRLAGTAVAYITNYKEFYGLDFYVDEHVLIPRPETEDLVDIALKSGAKSIADLGCGSGCIGTALLAQSSNVVIAGLTRNPGEKDLGCGSEAAMTTQVPETTTLSLDFYDISPEALLVTQKNLTNHNLKAKTTQSDIFTNFQDNKYDLIIANLPYVPEYMMTEKSIQSEPDLALVSGTDGLDHYRQLFSQAAPFTPLLLTESLLRQRDGMINIAAENNWALVEELGLAMLWHTAEQTASP